MESLAPAPTLYADWQERRRRSNELAERAAPLRVLDYLLQRYRGDPLAQHPARFPLPAELFLNRKAMLVHRHLSYAPRSGKNRSQRVGRLLENLKSLELQQSLGPPNGGACLSAEKAWDVSAKRVGEATLPPLRRDSNDLYREQLLSSEPHERIHAALQLSLHGSLDDVNLFLDLLSLTVHELIPVQVEADPLNEVEFDRLERWAFIDQFWVLWSQLKWQESIERQKTIDERALLERCAHRLARRKHTA